MSQNQEKKWHKLSFNFHSFAENKYNHLLACLISMLLLISLFDGRFIFGSLFVSFSFFIVIILVLKTLDLSKKVKIYSQILAIISLIVNCINHISKNQQSNLIFSVMSYLIHITFIALAITIITVEIFNSDKVNTDTLKGGISIYLMTGILWYFFYEIILLIDGNAFSINVEKLESYKLIYFSYTSLTTVGYGDITPVNRFAMTLSNLEAIIGQMYPAIFISRLVSLYEKK